METNALVKKMRVLPTAFHFGHHNTGTSEQHVTTNKHGDLVPVLKLKKMPQNN